MSSDSRPPASRKARRRLRMYREQGGRCYLCNERMSLTPGSDHNPDPRGITIEHVIPKSDGGRPYAMSNLAAACYACNQGKGSILPLDLTTPEGRDRALGLHLFLSRMATCTPLRKVVHL